MQIQRQWYGTRDWSVLLLNFSNKHRFCLMHKVSNVWRLIVELVASLSMRWYTFARQFHLYHYDGWRLLEVTTFLQFDLTVQLFK